MKLLNKLEYLHMLGNAPQPVIPDSLLSERVVAYVAKAWPSLKLNARELTREEVAGAVANGKFLFFSFKALPDELPTADVVVAATEERIEGHILMDRAAEWASPQLDCPSCDFLGAVNEADIRSMIPRIGVEDDNPFAVLTLGVGTYMQTLKTEHGYSLEYQLVNTSSHYEVGSPVTCQQVVEAMISFAFGSNQWLTELRWRLQVLDC